MRIKLVSHQNVLGLEVAMNIAMLMEFLQVFYHLDGDFPDTKHTHLAPFPYYCPQVRSKAAHEQTFTNRSRILGHSAEAFASTELLHDLGFLYDSQVVVLF